MHEFDAELTQDFITESTELLEQFDADLVLLERAPTDPDLLNRVFRALHTIKGSASFLSLSELVRVAHAAEEALNAARRGLLPVTREVMDLLLEGADSIKGHLAQLRRGEPLAPPRAALLDALTRLGSAEAVEETKAPPPSAGLPLGAGRTPLDLPAHKAALVEFMAADFEESILAMRAAVDALADPHTRADAASALTARCEPTASSAEFFGLDSITHAVHAIESVAERMDALNDDRLAQTLPRLRALITMLEAHALALKDGQRLDADASRLVERLTDSALGNPLDDSALLPPDASAHDALRLDCAWGASTAPAALQASAPAEPAHQTPTPPAQAGSSSSTPQSAATIRVDVERLEALLDLVGELVLQKNRVAAITRRVGAFDALPRDLRDALTQGAGDLDRVCGDLQLAVMRTRMQPLDRLFGRYPRLIRDLARSMNKNLRLVIEGGDTEVDKSVIEQLGDPLVHILRNSADHGVETPEQRRATGKPEAGTITLRARHEGEHVLVEVSDDGRGLNRERILARAVERALCTHDDAATMPDAQAYQFIFAPGFSTAEVVTDLSGRGVGMDVVRTNIEKVKGSISLRSAPGLGATVSIAIPLTVAILDAMMIGVGAEEYAIPLGSIVEIVKPDPNQVSTIRGRAVMRLRDEVLPLIDAGAIFDVPEARRAPSPFAIVLRMNGRSAGLLVSRLLGQREIVVKSLEPHVAGNAPVSGATVGDEGEASLIIDVARLLELADDAVRRPRITPQATLVA